MCKYKCVCVCVYIYTFLYTYKICLGSQNKYWESKHQTLQQLLLWGEIYAFPVLFKIVKICNTYFCKLKIILTATTKVSYLQGVKCGGGTCFSPVSLASPGRVGIFYGTALMGSSQIPDNLLLRCQHHCRALFEKDSPSTMLH